MRSDTTSSAPETRQSPDRVPADDLTVVIVNYRTPELTSACLRSLRRHEPPELRTKIVVVDNGSGDGSMALLAAGHPQVEVVGLPYNVGFAAGCNHVMKAVTSEYVLLLNSDAEVEDGTLAGLVAALRADGTVAAVGPRIMNGDGLEDQDYPYRFPRLREMLRRSLRGPQYPARGRVVPRSLERLHGACLMIRTSALANVGLFDEGFFMYDEDVDWCVRARNHGWQLLLIPTVRARHHGGMSSGRGPRRSRALLRPTEPPTGIGVRMRVELRRSRYRLYAKHRTIPEAAALKLLTDAALVLDSAKWLWRALNTPAQRRGALRVLQGNLAIMRMHPFRRPDPLDWLRYPLASARDESSSSG